ncbi:YKU80 ATP-dependent DNA helicase II subunit 2 [Candida maltosa Xu316]
MDDNSNDSESDFVKSQKFVFNYLNQHLIKNRKSDRFGLVVYSGSAIEVLYENAPLTLEKLQLYYSYLQEFHTNDPGDEDKYDVHDALVTAFQEFEKTLRYKFSRNLYLVTNGVLAVDESKNIEAYTDLIKDNNINVTLSLIPNDTNSETSDVFHDLQDGLDNVRFVDFNELYNSNSPLKLVAPKCITDGYLGFAELGNTRQGIENMVHLDIQVYPGVRSQTQTHGHEYYIDPTTKKISKVSRVPHYFIKKTNDSEDLNEDDLDEDGNEVNLVETIPVERSDCTSGFKYSNRDVLALSSELLDASTLETSPSINILGFIDHAKFPYAYLTDESSYVIPHREKLEDNRLGFNSLVLAMIETKCNALVRYVPKLDDEIQVCVAFPRKVRIDGVFGHILVLTRIAMKEDEKIGIFPKLEDSASEGVDDLMEQFIKSKKLRDSDVDTDIISNSKIALTQSDGTRPPTTPETSLDDILLSSNPANKRFNYYFQKILWASLQKESLYDFLTESNFVQKYLSVDEPHTMFNLNSILDSPEKFLYTHAHEKSNDISRKLQEKLDIKYKTQTKPGKRKREPGVSFGGPQPNDGKFDEYFDIEDILAG